MKNILVLALLTISVFMLWITSGYWRFSREDYISEKVLEMSMPFDVKIDVELINSLVPAYER